jgi:multiple sugar transport system ATP-binding protein
VASITLTDMEKVYDNGFHALHKMSLHIDDGEFLVLVGPSGCGKSTALRMIAGLESISSGELRVGDNVVNDLEPKDRDIAMVFQSYALYPHLSVRDNIAFALKLRKMPKEEIDQRVAEAARILELEEYLDRKPARLSGGQRQRVAMGRAIVRQPQVFLMDEPLSNLDAKLRVQMRAEISRLQQAMKTTTVYVTHDQVEAMTMGDRVAVMSKGVLQQVASPEHLYNSPDNLFVAAFIGSPQMNLVRGMYHRGPDGGTLKIGSQTLQLPASVAAGRPSLADYDGREVAVGIRPEHLSDAALETGRSNCIRGIVDIREGLGSEVIVYVKTDAQGVGVVVEPTEGVEPTTASLVARLGPLSALRPGDEALLAVETGAVHLFDLDSSLAIR